MQMEGIDEKETQADNEETKTERRKLNSDLSHASTKESESN